MVGVSGWRGPDDTWLANAGLEKVVGYPEFRADKVMEAMWKEHTEGAHATKEFEAWNNGVQRKTTCVLLPCTAAVPRIARVSSAGVWFGYERVHRN